MKVGIIDTGLQSEHWHWLQAGQMFVLGPDGVQSQSLEEDHLGHGSVVSRLVHEQAPDVPVLMAQVFGQRGATTAVQLAAAVYWLLEQGADLINCSLGLRADRTVLRDACQAAVGSGVILCASSPAMGQAVYPASYPGVVSVTGDARCQPQEWSWLQGERAEFGAAVGKGAEGGASMACARFSGLLAAYWNAHPAQSATQVLEHFRQLASRTGPQQREPLCANNE